MIMMMVKKIMILVKIIKTMMIFTMRRLLAGSRYDSDHGKQIISQVNNIVLILRATFFVHYSVREDAG